MSKTVPEPVERSSLFRSKAFCFLSSPICSWKVSKPPKKDFFYFKPNRDLTEPPPNLSWRCLAVRKKLVTPVA